MILEHWFDEVWNKKDYAAIDQLMSPDVVVHSLLAGGGERVYDRTSLKGLLVPVLEMLRELRVSVEDEFREGEMVAARCVITAIYDAEDAGALAQTRPIYFTGVAMARMRNGCIDESWNYFDFETMYQQME